MVNSCRYDQPYCFQAHLNIRELENLNTCLKRLYQKHLLIPISNNIADRDYLYLGTNIPSFHIPSLCMYTNIKHDPSIASQHSVMISCTHNDCIPSTIPAEPKPKERYEWKDIMQKKALICIPYEASTMSLFEHYSSGVPLFIPSKHFYKQLILSNKAVMCSFNTQNYWTNKIPIYLKDTTNLDWWLDRCDYYDNKNMPYVHYFDSWEDLTQQIHQFQFSKEAYAKKQEHLEKRKEWILNQWKKIMEKTFPVLMVNLGIE
jgi:hypothetical protein